MLIVSHSCTKSISINRKIAIWISREFLAVRNGKDDPKPHLIINIVNVTCGHERKTKCDNS